MGGRFSQALQRASFSGGLRASARARAECGLGRALRVLHGFVSHEAQGEYNNGPQEPPARSPEGPRADAQSFRTFLGSLATGCRRTGVGRGSGISISRAPGTPETGRLIRMRGWGAIEHPVVLQLDQRIQAAKNFGRQCTRLLAGSLKRLSSVGFPDVDKVPRATKVPRQIQMVGEEPLCVLKLTTGDRGHLLHTADGRWGCRTCGVNVARR
eukprot:5651968-Pyramimonas_sp.AAC.1